ncbi:MAG: histidine ammonia-lyase [Frankiaceae bacterium]|nr:histidine ammonia-lyase [Frankiaceae bacterium]
MIASMEPIILSGEGLRIADVVSVARDGRPVRLSEDAVERMRGARAVVARMLESGQSVYGLTTGVGALREVAQDPADAERYSHRSILAHCTAHGPPLPDSVVRAAMVHRANAFARGRAMVRPEVAQAYVDALNDGATPLVHSIGSVGQSDLPAMAEIARGLLERGLRLQQGEALALLNANSLSVGHAALALADARNLLDSLDVVAALSMEGFAANPSVLHLDVAAARPYRGLGETITRLRELLDGSHIWQPDAARHLQDPLSFRSLPQVHGAARDAFGFAEGQLQIELNSSGDNPMLVPLEERFISVGNFDITPVAAAIDFARIALGQVLTATCERVQKQLAQHFSGIATGLRAVDGPDDALALVGGGAAALAAEARLLAGPVSLDVPTSSIAGGIEDHMSMAPLGARRLAEMVSLGSRLAAVELAVAAQAVDLRGVQPLGRGTGAAHSRTREMVAFVGPGEVFSNDLDELAEWVAAGMPRPA